MTPVLTGPLEHPFLPSLQREPVRGLAPLPAHIPASNLALFNQLDQPGLEAVQPLVHSALKKTIGSATTRKKSAASSAFAPGEEVARITFFGLFALQHRGQESAGIAVSDGRHINGSQRNGAGHAGLRRRRYPDTAGHHRHRPHPLFHTGSSILCNAQPICLHVARRRDRRRAQRQSGQHRSSARGTGSGRLRRSRPPTTAKSSRKCSPTCITDCIEETVKAAMQRLQGAYSLVILTPDKLIGVRDPYGVRPLCLGTD